MLRILSKVHVHVLVVLFFSSGGFCLFQVVDFVFFLLQSGTIRYGPPTPFLSPLQQEYSQFTENKALVRFTV